MLRPWTGKLGVYEFTRLDPMRRYDIEVFMTSLGVDLGDVVAIDFMEHSCVVTRLLLDKRGRPVLDRDRELITYPEQVLYESKVNS
jgi:hypothetical protein